jgi:hypothetical protein
VLGVRRRTRDHGLTLIATPVDSTKEGDALSSTLASAVRSGE